MKKTAGNTFWLGICLLMVFATGCGPQAINKAAERGNLADVERLLQNGTDVNARYMFGMTPIMGAAYRGHLDVVKYLLDKGADINARETTTGKTPLMQATAAGKLDVVEFLKQHGAKE